MRPSPHRRASPDAIVVSQSLPVSSAGDPKPPPGHFNKVASTLPATPTFALRTTPAEPLPGRVASKGVIISPPRLQSN